MQYQRKHVTHVSLKKNVLKRTRALCFNTGSKHLVKDESTWPTASCFHLSLDFGTRHKALTLVLTQNYTPTVVNGGVDGPPPPPQSFG